MRPELVEHGGNLRAGCPSADNKDRDWNRRQTPRVAVSSRVLEARYRKPPTRSAAAQDDAVRFYSRSVLALQFIGVKKSNGARVFVDRHACPLEVGTQARVRTHPRAG